MALLRMESNLASLHGSVVATAVQVCYYGLPVS